MERLTTVLLAHRRVVLAAWVLLIVLGGVFAAGLPGRIVPGGEAPASSQSEAVARALAHGPLPSLFVTIRVAAGTTPRQQAQLTSSVAAAALRVKGVTQVSPMPDTRPAQPDGARVAVLNVSANGGTDGAVKTAHALSRSLARVGPNAAAQVYVGGFGAYRDELTVDSQQDLERAERVGIPIVLVVLLLTFGSIWAAALPLAIALSALVIGLGGVAMYAAVVIAVLFAFQGPARLERPVVTWRRPWRATAIRSRLTAIVRPRCKPSSRTCRISQSSTSHWKTRRKEDSICAATCAPYRRRSRSSSSRHGTVNWTRFPDCAWGRIFT